MYEEDRLLYPLKKIGDRKQGRWERISWDQALTEISQKIVEVIRQAGPGALMIHTGTGILSQGRRAGPLRLGSLLGAIRLYPASAVGDMFTGATLAYGITNIGHSLDAWFQADHIILWGINPNITRMPDAHYLWEAKYQGATIVSIAPDYNPSSIHCSYWLPIRPGTDSFLAMALVNVVIREGLYRERMDFIREQTDLPFLVRTDNQKLLRRKDLEGEGEDFYLWDLTSRQAVIAPGTMGNPRDTLRLGQIIPALEGTYRIKGHQGEEIEVTTAFEYVRREAERFSPEQVSEVTGIHPRLIYRLAREFSQARKGIINIGFSLHKYAWGILTCWAAALLCALTGHSATFGGIDTEHNWSLGGLGTLSTPKPPRFGSGFIGEWMLGHMWKTFLQHYDDAELRERAGITREGLLNFLQQSLDKGWLPYFGEPRVLLLFADNRYWRNKAEQQYQEATLSRLDLYVNINHRMDSSALLADYVLPSLSHYETWDLRGELGYHRFVNLTIPPTNLRPVGEAKSEWEICRLLALKIEEQARRVGLTRLEDRIRPGSEPVVRDLNRLHQDFTMGGRLMTDRDVVEWIMKNVPAMKPWTLDNAQRRGFFILNQRAGLTSPLYSDRPYHSFERQVYLKRPYPTQSGRQQFYIDHELFRELNTTVPTARAPLRPSRFPFIYYSPHTRWGIHTQWRTNKYMLRLQRGVPHVYLNPEVARSRGIRDGDLVRVFNDVGEYRAMAKLHPSVPPSVIMIDHAWEPYQFPGRRGLNSTIAGLLCPLELAGGYGHLSFSPNWDGNQIAHESGVDIERIGRVGGHEDGSS